MFNGKNSEEEEMKIEKGDQVVFKCINPATGWVKRVAKDGSWADVEWNASINRKFTQRVKSKDILKTNPIFNRLAGDPFARVFIPEAK